MGMDEVWGLLWVKWFLGFGFGDKRERERERDDEVEREKGASEMGDGGCRVEGLGMEPRRVLGFEEDRVREEREKGGV